MENYSLHRRKRSWWIQFIYIFDPKSPSSKIKEKNCSLLYGNKICEHVTWQIISTAHNLGFEPLSNRGIFKLRKKENLSVHPPFDSIISKIAEKLAADFLSIWWTQNVFIIKSHFIIFLYYFSFLSVFLSFCIFDDKVSGGW